jgi:retron-type reverse transcriptase
MAQKVKDETYTFQPARQTLIPKPGRSKKRPIDTLNQDDRIVQEVIRGILETIYEPEFSAFEEANRFRCTNYGFRVPGLTFIHTRW